MFQDQSGQGIKTVNFSSWWYLDWYRWVRNFPKNYNYYSIINWIFRESQDIQRAPLPEKEQEVCRICLSDSDLQVSGGVRSPNSIHFHIKIRFYWYLRRVMSLMWDRVGMGSKVPPTQKSALRPKKHPSTQKMPLDPKNAPRPKKCTQPKNCSDPKIYIYPDRFIPSDRWKYACQSPTDGFLHFFNFGMETVLIV